MKIAICGDPHIQDRNLRSRKDEYFDTVYRKLDEILSNNDKIIFLGDMFTNPTIPFLYLNKLIALFAKHRGKAISLIGNHDVYNYNVNTLPKTTMGLLSNVGLLEVVKEGSFTVSNLVFNVIPLSMDLNKVPVDTTNTRILLGHCYFENNLDVKYSLTREQIEKLNYKYVFLGHDHQNHESKQYGNSILLRPGSMTRYEGNPYNLTRTPQYIQIDTDKNTMNYIPFTVEPPEVVFSEEYISGKSDGKVVNVLNLDDIISGGYSYKAKSSNSIVKELDELGIDQESFDYLRDIHLDENVIFN